MPAIYKDVTVKKKQHIKLPDVVTTALGLTTDKEIRAAYVFALRAKGWTLQAVADSLGFTRERIRQISLEASPELVYLITQAPGTYPVPELPTITKRVQVGYQHVDPSPEVLARLKELQPIAQSVRWDHSGGRAAAEEYTALLWKAHTEQGVSVYRLGKLLGVTHGAIQFRFARYGYKQSPTGQTKVYKQIKKQNRAKDE